MDHILKANSHYLASVTKLSRGDLKLLQRMFIETIYIKYFKRECEEYKFVVNDDYWNNICQIFQEKVLTQQTSQVRDRTKLSFQISVMKLA